MNLNLSDQVRADTAQLCEGGALPAGVHEIDCHFWHFLALIGCVDPGEVDSCKWNYSHWAEPKTADLHLILLSDHNDNFSKYDQEMVTDYSFKIRA